MKILIAPNIKASAFKSNIKNTTPLLLPVGNKALFSRFLESFPKNSEFIVLISEGKEDLIDYAALAHPEMNIFFLDHHGTVKDVKHSRLQSKKNAVWGIRNEKTYQQALAKYQANYTFPGKNVEYAYRIQDRVIKFFADKKGAELRFKRAKDYPRIFAKPVHCRGRFFSYVYQPGRMLSSCINEKEVMKFLRWAQKHLWRRKRIRLSSAENINRQFYRNKTLLRLQNFLALYLRKEPKYLIINGRVCPSIETLMRKIPSDFYQQGQYGLYHGDLHDDNIVITSAGYRLIDWRDRFGPSVDIGDCYYDLAKFFHTLDLSVAVMASGAYSFKKKGRHVHIFHSCSRSRQRAQKAFWSFVTQFGCDPKRIELITALLFINMAPFYPKLLAQYLYYLGRYRLTTALASSN